ncbi:hypothetical protein ABT294_48465 [Nonomuraea sp. NPDC000554]|uniref:hypothetical protein n=1 Tax=Nonomuraea sp. NPDC000554 TaxID=3154259 RepID=UPI0033217E18
MNVVVVPAAAVAVVHVLALDGPVAYGIVLAAAAPGGGTGTLLTYHARGDLALGGEPAGRPRLPGHARRRPHPVAGTPSPAVPA